MKWNEGREGGSRGIALQPYTFFNLGSRQREWSLPHDTAALLPQSCTGTHFTGIWVTVGPVWTGAENVAPKTRFEHRTTQPVALTLYRLRYPNRNERIYCSKTLTRKKR
jgi:hypothetical protein